MSDLISRSELINLMNNKYIGLNDAVDLYHGGKFDCFKEIKLMIKKQPTAFDIDKVVEELEERKQEYLDGFVLHENNELYGVACGLGDAIEIVKQGCVTDDVCEWKSNYRFVSDKYKRETSCGYTFYDLHHAVPFKYCPYCGKKIKAGGENDKSI